MNPLPLIEMYRVGNIDGFHIGVENHYLKERMPSGNMFSLTQRLSLLAMLERAVVYQEEHEKDNIKKYEDG